jgi:hypothetical protein
MTLGPLGTDSPQNAGVGAEAHVFRFAVQVIRTEKPAFALGKFKRELRSIKDLSEF